MSDGVEAAAHGSRQFMTRPLTPIGRRHHSQAPKALCLTNQQVGLQKLTRGQQQWWQQVVAAAE
ncbi:hypothetical protein IAQ61_007894 [Plenodomus lingam]|uniref:uncharacterized protein n=1 Tax=Leptosphaeria maculans TaxID=5022 RepID=UPI003325A2FC|nr:hypothetical protein IAQ61_007894 [Plenodomus lingam]